MKELKTWRDVIQSLLNGESVEYTENGINWYGLDEVPKVYTFELDLDCTFGRYRLAENVNNNYVLETELGNFTPDEAIKFINRTAKFIMGR